MSDTTRSKGSSLSCSSASSAVDAVVTAGASTGDGVFVACSKKYGRPPLGGVWGLAHTGGVGAGAGAIWGSVGTTGPAGASTGTVSATGTLTGAGISAGTTTISLR